MKQRVAVYGQTTDERLADAKLRSMKSASLNSYQGEDILYKGEKYRCLINPSKLVEDYDQKIISIDFKVGMKPGDTFYWIRTDSHWIGLLKQWTEEAYLRMEIRRCNYCITINDFSKYWVYVKGPSEKTLDWEEEADRLQNRLNYILEMYITKNEETKEYFDRFQEVRIDGKRYKVTATDKVTSDGIIQVYLQEDFNTDILDEAKKEDDIKTRAIQMEKEKEVFQEIKQAAEQSEDTVLKPKIMIIGPEKCYCFDENVEYRINSEEIFREGFIYTWETDTKNVEILNQTQTSCTLKIKYKKANTFRLMLKENDLIIAEKQIIVQSI